MLFKLVELTALSSSNANNMWIQKNKKNKNNNKKKKKKERKKINYRRRKTTKDEGSKASDLSLKC